MRYVSILLITLFFSGQAFAGECPTLMNKVDSEMATTQLDAETRAEVEELRARGEALHSEGKHAESEDALMQAIEILEGAAEQGAEA